MTDRHKSDSSEKIVEKILLKIWEWLQKNISEILVQAFGIFFGAYLSFMFIPAQTNVKRPSPESANISNSGLLPANTTFQVISQDSAVPVSVDTSSPYAHVFSSGDKTFVSVNQLPKGQTVELQAKKPIKVNVVDGDSATIGSMFDIFKTPSADQDHVFKTNLIQSDPDYDKFASAWQKDFDERYKKWKKEREEKYKNLAS